MNLIKHLIVLGIMIFASATSTYAQKPKVKIGIAVSHLYDLYEGPVELTSTVGSINYTSTDIDLKGLNGEYTKFDIGLGLLVEVAVNDRVSLTAAFTKGNMTSQFENLYATSDLSMLTMGYRRYFRPNSDKGKPHLSPYCEVGVGATYFAAERYFVQDQGLFSKTEELAFNSSISVGCIFNLNRKLSVTAAPNFIINYSDAVDGYKNRGVDIMMSSTIGVLFSL